MEIGKNIQAARKAAKMTQKQLADRMGTTSQNISQYERGIRHPKFKKLYWFAQVLGCSVTDLDPSYTVLAYGA